MTANSADQQRFKVDKICVIGAGPSGLATAKYRVFLSCSSILNIH